MTKEEYEKLLKSDYWRGFSYSLIKERNFKCEDCGRQFYNQRNKLQVHHLVYRDVNPWSYKPEELVVLCEECHKKRHGIKVEDRQYQQYYFEEDATSYTNSSWKDIIQSYTKFHNNSADRNANANANTNTKTTKYHYYDKRRRKRVVKIFCVLGVIVLIALLSIVRESPSQQEQVVLDEIVAEPVMETAPAKSHYRKRKTADSVELNLEGDSSIKSEIVPNDVDFFNRNANPEINNEIDNQTEISEEEHNVSDDKDLEITPDIAKLKKKRDVRFNDVSFETNDRISPRRNKRHAR